jgi:DNA-binding XRE family transcriptional regulator
MRELRIGTIRVLFAFDRIASRSCCSAATSAARGTTGMPARFQKRTTCTKRIWRRLHEDKETAMTKKWSEIRHKAGDSEDARAKRAELARRLEGAENAHAVTLAALRRALEITQAQLAERMGVSQAQVSRIEHGTDLALSTLERHLGAIGGELEICVVFPDGIRVPIELSDITAAVAEHESAPV